MTKEKGFISFSPDGPNPRNHPIRDSCFRLQDPQNSSQGREHTASTHSVLAGSAKANGREPKTCLGRVFNYKLGCFDDVFVFIYVYALPHL